MNAEKVQKSLESVKALFIERYRLQPSDDSAGLRSIERAIASGAGVSIANLRGVLSQYNLYPQYEMRMATLLSEAEAALTEEDESPATAQLSEAPVEDPEAEDEAPAEPGPPTPIKANATRAPKTPKSRGK